MPQPDPRVLALVDGAANARDQLEERIARLVAALWGAFDGWFQDALVAEISAQVAEMVSRGQVGVAQLTDAYLAQVATVVRERPVGPVGVAAGMALSRRDGVTLDEVYGRVAAEYRWQVSRDVVPIAAKAIALQRANAMVSTDLGLAFRDQTQRFMERTGAAGYRRVIRPESSRSGTCWLCVAASNRVYHRSDLMPLHARCRCTVVEVGGRVDEGRVINDAEYAAVAAQADSLHASDLVKVRVKHHGELGPVLTDAAHDFRGPRQVAA